MLDIIACPQSAGNYVGDNMSTYKNCRVSNGKVHLDVMVDGVRFRKSTGRNATKAELKYVEKNWRSEYERLKGKDELAPQQSKEELLLGAYGFYSLEVNRINRTHNINKEYLGIYKSRILPYFGQVPLNTIKQTDIKKWQTDLLESGVSHKRVHNIRMVFQGIMKDAYADGLIDRNPFEGLKGMRQGRDETNIVPFTLDEIKMMLTGSTGWFKNFLTLAFFSGMRTGEMLALEWDDVDFENNKIYIRQSIRQWILKEPKTKHSIRSIDMLEMVRDALLVQRQLTSECKNVFVSRFKQSFSDATSVRDTYWYTLLTKLGMPKRTMYQTRHTFATMMIRQNEDITWVSYMLGHANSAITLGVYTKYREEKNVKRARFLDGFQLEVA